MAKRAPLSKKTRFEVFKRDAFTCQYCGQKAPDVVLHVDHISPVSKGGGNDLLNLITACVACNSGKGARALSDLSVAEVQKAQLEELRQKHEQLEALIAWRDSSRDLTERKVDEAVRAINGYLSGEEVNDVGRQKIRNVLNKHSLDTVLKAIDACAEKYLDGGRAAGARHRQYVSLFFQQLPMFCKVVALPREEQEFRYVRGILKNRVGPLDKQDMDEALYLIRTAVDAGVDIEALKEFTKNVDDYSQWRSEVASFNL